MISRRLSILLSLHAMMILCGTVFHVLDRNPPKGVTTYLRLLASDFHWGIFGKVFNFQDFDITFSVDGREMPMRISEPTGWIGEPLLREDYFYWYYFWWHPRSAVSKDHVERWCRNHGLDADTVVGVESRIKLLPREGQTHRLDYHRFSFQCGGGNG